MGTKLEYINWQVQDEGSGCFLMMTYSALMEEEMWD